MNKPVHNKQLGNEGESYALHYAESVLGWKCLGKNLHFKVGEIDLLFTDPQGELIFVEVKTRQGTQFGCAVESVNPQKGTRFKKACLEWLRRGPYTEFSPFRMECFALQKGSAVWDLERFVLE